MIENFVEVAILSGQGGITIQKHEDKKRIS
jgi:hypothetical protein